METLTDLKMEKLALSLLEENTKEQLMTKAKGILEMYQTEEDTEQKERLKNFYSMIINTISYRTVLDSLIKL